MKPQRTTPSWARWIAVAMGSLSIVAVGTVVSHSVVNQVEPEPQVQAAVVERPSYLSQLPEITQQALRAGVITPSTARAPAGDLLPVRTAALAPAASPATAADVQPVAPAEEVAQAQDLQLFQVTTNGLNVRSGPSGDSGKLFVLKRDEAVQVAEVTGGWARVMTASGESGWAAKKYLAPAQ